MIRPISQQQVQNINNPYGNSLARLSQTFQNIGQQNQQNRLMKMQEEQQLLERKIKTAPIAKQFVDQAMALPEEQRAEFFLQNKDTISQLGFYDYSDINPNDFKDETLAQVSQRLTTMIPNSKGKLVQGVDPETNKPAFFRDTGGELVNVPGAMPPEKSALVNINNGGQKGLEQMSKNAADEIAADRTKANSAREMNTVFDSIERDMKLFNTGKASGAELTLRQVGEVFGAGDKTKLAAGERLSKNFNKLVSQNMEFLKGAMSDGEREFTRQFTIGMDTTTDGNKKMIKFLRGVNERYKTKAKMKQEWFRKNKGDLFGFDEAWDKYIEANPILSKEEMNSMIAPSVDTSKMSDDELLMELNK